MPCDIYIELCISFKEFSRTFQLFKAHQLFHVVGDLGIHKGALEPFYSSMFITRQVANNKNV